MNEKNILISQKGRRYLCFARLLRSRGALRKISAPLLLTTFFFLSPPLSAAERSLSYKEALRIAFEKNSDIKIARLEEELGDAFINQAQALFDTQFFTGADWMDDRDKPSSTVPGTRNKTGVIQAGLGKKLLFGATANLQFKNIYKETNSAFSELKKYWDPRLELTITQPLLKNAFGTNDRRELKRARFQAEISKQGSKEKIEGAMQAISNLYWELSAAASHREIKKQALADAERLLSANQKKLKLGLVEKTDLLASEANVSARENDLLIAQNQWDFAHTHLKIALRDDSGDVIVAKDPLKHKEVTPAFEESIRKAFHQRKDYKIAKEELQFKMASHGIRKNALLPELNVTGMVAYNGLDPEYEKAIEDVGTFDFPTYFIGATLTFALENHEARGAYQKSRIEKLQALYRVEKLENEIRLDIAKKIELLKTHGLQVKTSDRISRLLKQKKIAEEEKFNQGRSSINFVVQSQEDYLVSQSNAIQVLLNYEKTLLDLKRSEGSLLEEMIQELI
ncbi:MAG: TolC family protein [Deltaproteobacteria bacterium]